MLNGNLKIAIQKKGRLADKSLELLKACGLEIDTYSNRLLLSAKNFELDILLLRDDDIPEYVQDGVADIGIVGQDVIEESGANIKEIKQLGFGKCRLMIGIPENEDLTSLENLNNRKIATSFPNILQKYLEDNNITAKIIELSGSVEIAPSLGIADCICDLVSTGTTLKLNKLKKSFTVFDSQASLIARKDISEDEEKRRILEQLLVRIESVLNAKKSKYLMLNVAKENLENVVSKIPSLKSPTVLPLAENDMLAIHAVIPNTTFWDSVSELKDAGASGILLLPIENMIL